MAYHARKNSMRALELQTVGHRILTLLLGGMCGFGL